MVKASVFLVCLLVFTVIYGSAGLLWCSEEGELDCGNLEQYGEVFVDNRIPHSPSPNVTFVDNRIPHSPNFTFVDNRIPHSIDVTFV